MTNLTLNEARGIKGYTMNSLEAAMRFIDNSLMRTDLDPTIRSRMIAVRDLFGETYGILAGVADEYLPAMIDIATNDLEYEREQGVLQGQF